MPDDIPPGGPRRDDEGPNDPLQEMISALFSGGSLPEGMPDLPPGFDPSTLAAAFPGGQAQFADMLGQVQKMMSSPSDEPVNYELAADTARKVASAKGDPMPGDAQGRAARDALVLANAWLDECTAFPATHAVMQVWSRAEWVEATLPTWKTLAGPVAASVTDAMSGAMAKQLPPDMAAIAGQAAPMMKSMGSGVFGAQLGQAIGTLAGEVLSCYDIGLQLASGDDMALVTSNIEQFAADLEVSESDVTLYLLLREAAHQRLYTAVPWLHGRVMQAIEAYAVGIHIDTDRIAEAVEGIDPSNPEALTEALGDGMLRPATTPEQQAALDRLELLLALIEGWVDHIVGQATSGKMASAPALAETMRRRRAAGGPAEHTLASLVGLNLRPRRLRDAATVWAALLDGEGADGRDSIWDHPDLLPEPAELDDPTAAVERLRARGETQEDVDFDAALRSLLDGETGEAPKPDGGEEPDAGEGKNA